MEPLAADVFSLGVRSLDAFDRRSRGNHLCALTFSPKGRRHPSGADNANRGGGPSRAQGEAARGQAVL